MRLARSAFNSEASVQPATIVQRAQAFLIDYALILAYLSFLFLAATRIWPAIQTAFLLSAGLAQLTGFALVTFPVTLYFAVGDSAAGRSTLGKRRMGLRVVGLDGAPVSFGRSLWRTCVKFAPWELSHFFLHQLMRLPDGPSPPWIWAAGGAAYGLAIAYAAAAVWTPRRQSLYDVAAGTYVARVG